MIFVGAVAVTTTLWFVMEMILPVALSNILCLTYLGIKHRKLLQTYEQNMKKAPLYYYCLTIQLEPQAADQQSSVFPDEIRYITDACSEVQPTFDVLQNKIDPNNNSKSLTLSDGRVIWVCQNLIIGETNTDLQQRLLDTLQGKRDNVSAISFMC